MVLQRALGLSPPFPPMRSSTWLLVAQTDWHPLLSLGGLDARWEPYVPTSQIRWTSTGNVREGPSYADLLATRDIGLKSGWPPLSLSRVFPTSVRGIPKGAALQVNRQCRLRAGPYKTPRHRHPHPDALQ